jgi:hypothetical protein
MSSDFSFEIPTIPSANQNQSDTSNFNYTFDGTTLTLSENGTAVSTLTYNKSNDTFTMPIPNADEEMAELGVSLGELLGTTQVVFHKK